jgi:sugar O-acyltransferase (sialic acid O-acetyltransferase NeuD family)
MNKPKLILIGGGGHCRACIDVIEAENRFDIAGIIEKDQAAYPPIFGYPVLGCDNELKTFRNVADFALITVGQIENADLRIKLFQQAQQAGFILPIVKSPNAWVSQHAQIDEGTIVMHHAVVNAGAKTGKNCILNTKSLIEHDCIVGNHCHISTGAILNGAVSIGDGSFIGSNAVVVQGVSIPSESFIKSLSLTKPDK